MIPVDDAHRTDTEHLLAQLVRHYEREYGMGTEVAFRALTNDLMTLKFMLRLMSNPTVEIKPRKGEAK